MIKILNTITLLTLISCGRTYYNDRIVEVPSDPEVIEKEIIVEKEVIKLVAQEFEGKYILTHNSKIELLQNYEGNLVVSSSDQLITTKNPKNGTYGTLPRFAGETDVYEGNIAHMTVNLNYTSGNDIEEDVSGANITGTKRTDIEISKIDGSLKIVVKIYDDRIGANENEIIAKRVFKEKLEL